MNCHIEILRKRAHINVRCDGYRISILQEQVLILSWVNAPFIRAHTVLGVWTLKVNTVTRPFLVLSNMRTGPFLKWTGRHGLFLKSTRRHGLFLKPTGRHSLFLKSTGRHHHFSSSTCDIGTPPSTPPVLARIDQ